MHTLTFVPLEIEDCTNPSKINLAEDAIYEFAINNLKAIEKRNMNEDIHLCGLLGRQNMFSREVVNALEEKMEPYCEQTEDPKYLEFIDKTDEIAAEYENGTIDCLKDPCGIIKPVYKWHDFEIRDGVVYEKAVGRLHHPMRTKKAKKMTAIPQYPMKKLFSTFEQFAEDYWGCQLDTQNTQEKRYGYYLNPRSFWDWYQIGGRWPYCFLIPDSCTEYNSGELSSSDMEAPEAPEGFRWCCAARKKDIAWQTFFEWHKTLATERFYEFEKIYKSGDENNELSPFGRITEEGIRNFDGLAYAKDETLEQFLERHGYFRESKYHASAGALLFEYGEYFDTFERCNGEWKERSNWAELVEKFIDELSDDTVIVGVDCHV